MIIVAFISLLLFCSVNGQHSVDTYVGGEYLNPDKVRETDPICDVRVTCYDRGLWWVCPNPFDKYRTEPAEEQYNRGMYVKKSFFCVSKAFFNEVDNWNS